MLKRLVAAVAIFWLAPLLTAQEGKPDFAGTWQGSFKGTVFCVLQIEGAGDAISGTLRPGRITANDDGEITEAEPSPPDTTYPLINPKVDGKTLAFEWKEGDAELLKFEFVLNGASEGELRLVNEDHLKPIRMQRAK
jgi:hypothetical protein